MNNEQEKYYYDDARTRHNNARHYCIDEEGE